MSVWPQYTMASFYLLSFVHSLYGDGKLGQPSRVAVTLVVYFVMVWILYCGGFWSPLGFAP